MSNRIFIVFLLCLLCVSFVSADCTVYSYSASGLPIAYSVVLVKNSISNVTIMTNSTDLLGSFTYLGDCSNLSFSFSLPSSNYSAVIVNASVASPVPMDDFIRARLRLVNTLGQALEAQDCKVSALSSDGSALIYSWDTLCRQGEPYLDSSGNWAAVSNCSFTDSQGWYYFRGLASRSSGFVYGDSYVLNVVCNGQSINLPFSMNLGKHEDLNEIEAWAANRTGLILLYFLGIIVLGFIIVVFVKWIKGRKGKDGVC